MENLTAKWRAYGARNGVHPNQWRNSRQTREFEAHLVSKGAVATFETDALGNVWAHPDLAMSYAEYLDPALRVKHNEALFGKAGPTAAQVQTIVKGFAISAEMDRRKVRQ